MKGYIYKIVNKINNKKYVGQTLDFQDRIYKHFNELDNKVHHSVKLQRAYDKYGRKNFEVFYEIVQVDTIEDLYLLEIKAIAQEDSFNNGYNMTMGGEGNKLIFDYDTSVLIYQLFLRYDGIERQLARHYNCDRSALHSIRNNKVLYEEEQYDSQKLQDLIQQLELKDENKIESYKPHNNKKLDREKCFEILSIITTEIGYDKTLCEIFNINSKLTYRLRRGLIYKDFINEFNALSEEEKQNIKNNTVKKYEINKIYGIRSRRCVKNALTQEQIDYILDNVDKISKAQIARDLNISADRVGQVAMRKSYKDLIQDYDNRHNSNN